MALRISRIKPAPAPTPRQALTASITEFIASEPALAAQLPADHPLISFELLNLSEALTFRISLRQQPEVSAVGCAPVFDLTGLVPGGLNLPGFTLAVRAVLRALLFWTGADLSRENLRLIDHQGRVEWQALVHYLERALQPLSLEVAIDLAEEALTLTLSADGCVPARLRIGKGLIEAQYGPAVSQLGHLRANEAIKDHLLIQLSRLVLELKTPEQMEVLLAAQQEAAEAQIPRVAEGLAAESLRQSADSLAGKLSGSIAGLSVG